MRTSFAAMMALMASVPAFAETYSDYKVKVTNLTWRQPMSPVVVVFHTKDIRIFEDGEMASMELKALAENGDASGLLAVLDESEYVCGYTVSDGPIPPGMTFQGMITSKKHGYCERFYVSAASMLVNTNDAFMGMDSGALKGSYGVFYPPAYDAGTEMNNEDCMFIPGPGCAKISTENKDTPDMGEGYVHIHRGMHDVTPDLPAATYDWRNGVAKVHISEQI